MSTGNENDPVAEALRLRYALDETPAEMMPGVRRQITKLLHGKTLRELIRGPQPTRDSKPKSVR